MNRKVVWLISLLTIWMAAAVLWMGFTLPAMTGVTPIENHLVGSATGRNPLSQKAEQQSVAESTPLTLKSLVNSDELLIDDEIIKSWQHWVANKSQGAPVRLVVTGYQLSEEDDHTALGRAKAFKLAIEKEELMDFVLVEEFRDNLPKKDDIIQDVVGVSIVRYTPGENNNFFIETSPELLNGEINKLQRMANVIQSSRGLFMELTYCTKDAYESLEKNRNKIRELKDELKKFGIPRHKIIGNLQKCDADTAKIILELK
ncbi:MAG TPA: hypothetical protein VJ917_09945 [Saprospiraceae bacterium]|nr:hypothetical protein [Saprospiraceae bacterium]